MHRNVPELRHWEFCRLVSRIFLSAIVLLAASCVELSAQQAAVASSRYQRQLVKQAPLRTLVRRNHQRRGQSLFERGAALHTRDSFQSPQSQPIFPNVVSFLGVDLDYTGQRYGVPVHDFNGDGIDEVVVVIECNNFYNCDRGVINTGTGAYDSGGLYPYFVTEGDFNGDGRPDLAVLNFCSDDNCTNSSIGIFLENADGTFQPAKVYVLPALQGLSLAAADFNGDGKADLALANSSSIQILLSNGDGTFHAGQTISASPGSIATADFNLDGHADLAITTSSGVSVLLGNGEGSFQAPQPFSTGGTAQFVVVADLNHDKRPDLVVSNKSRVSPCSSETETAPFKLRN